MLTAEEDPTLLMLCCADACPEVAQVAVKDPVIMSDRRVLDQLLQLEPFSLPSSDYFVTGQQVVEGEPSRTTELQPYMRRVVTTWMLEVTEEQNCEEQVFPLAVNLLDRFLASEAAVLERCQLQLLGCVCLLTASKLRQCRPIGVDLLVYYTDYSVTSAQIRVWEMLLLSKLGWDVSGVTAFDFVDHLMERIGTSSTSTGILRGHALTHVSLCCTETDYMRVRPSLIAAACIAAAANRLSGENSAPMELLASLVHADPTQLALLVRSIETLMCAQLASVQQQQQQQQEEQQQQQQHHVQQLQHHLKNSSAIPAASKSSSSAWELDIQPETPTDIQDIHF